MRNGGWWIGAVMSCVACAAAAPAPTSPTSPGSSSSSGSSGDVARGESVYARFCETCHGAKGNGQGPTAAAYGSPRPLDFTRGAYEFRTTEEGQLPLRSDITRDISLGVPGTKMPAWGRILPPQDIDAVAAYIETFSPRFAAEPQATRRVVTIPREPRWPLSASQIESGRLLFIAAQCWECHGLDGKGDGPASHAQKDAWKRPIPPADLTSTVHRCGPTATDLYRTVMTGLNGTPMSSFKRTLGLGRERLTNLGDDAKKLKPSTVKQVMDFVAKLPSQDEIDNLGDAELESLVETRVWLIVGYIRSIERHSPVVDWFLRDDP